jgi:anti-anti-sigma factor
MVAAAGLRPVTASQEGRSVIAGDNAAPFRVSVIRSGPRAVVRLTGKLDYATAPDLEGALEDLLAMGLTDLVVVEAGQLTFSDVIGAGLLIDAADRLAPHGRLVVRDACREVARLLTALGHPELVD